MRRAQFRACASAVKGAVSKNEKVGNMAYAVVGGGGAVRKSGSDLDGRRAAALVNRELHQGWMRRMVHEVKWNTTKM